MVALQCGQDLTHDPIALVDPIAIDLGAALALELRRGHDGRVGNTERQIEEERPARLGPLVDVRHGLLGQQRLDLDGLDIGNDLVLLDDHADVAGVGVAAKVIEAAGDGAIGGPRADRQRIVFVSSRRTSARSSPGATCRRTRCGIPVV